MSDDLAIRVYNLGKCYHIFSKPIDRLKQLISFQKKYYQEFWALKNINFEIQKGKSLGIIGRNGSGKSTLLQLICKTLTPTTGTIETKGKIAALLELGAGFNPEFTGRENIYINGAILGFNRKEMDEHLDDILSFADIGNFIDQAVKTYSSGMFVRLAFSVQVSIKPDILIVDEALSVGDVFFQQKCAGRMQELREQGTTLLFISHDMSSVRDLCEQAIYLDAGELIYSGRSTDAIRRYFLSNNNSSFIIPVKKPPSHNLKNENISAFLENAFWINNCNDEEETRIIAIAVFDENNIQTLTTKMTHKLRFQILYQSFLEKKIDVGLVLRNRYNHVIHCRSTRMLKMDVPPLQSGEYLVIEFEINCMLEAGNYTFYVALSYLMETTSEVKIIGESPWLGPITITWDYENEKAPWLGMFGLPVTGRVIPLKEAII